MYTTPFWHVLTFTAVMAAVTGRSVAAGPVVGEARPAPEWDALFAGKQGWIGGDAVYSAVLGPKRVLWLFGDTLLGEAKDGRRAGALMVNNTVGVQAGTGPETPIGFMSGKPTDGKPTAFVTLADGVGWFWPQAAVRVADKLFLFLAQIEKGDDPGVLGFREVGQWLAVVDNPDADPRQWRVKQHRVVGATFEPGHLRSWGSAVLEHGKHLYVYGFDERRGKGLARKRLLVARVPLDKVADFTAWRFRSADGWSDQVARSAPLADGLSTEFSVSPAPNGDGFVAVYTENGFGDRIVARFAAAPEGPWSPPTLLYTCPEMAKDQGVFCYAAKAHPWAAGRGELLVSYCVNTWDFGRLFRDDQVYRPRFVRVPVRWRE